MPDKTKAEIIAENEAAQKLAGERLAKATADAQIKSDALEKANQKIALLEQENVTLKTDGEKFAEEKARLEADAIQNQSDLRREQDEASKEIQRLKDSGKATVENLSSAMKQLNVIKKNIAANNRAKYGLIRGMLETWEGVNYKKLHWEIKLQWPDKNKDMKPADGLLNLGKVSVLFKNGYTVTNDPRVANIIAKCGKICSITRIDPDKKKDEPELTLEPVKQGQEPDADANVDDGIEEI